MAWLALAAIALLLTSLGAAAALRLSSPVSFLLAAYLAAGVEIVLLGEALSLAGAARKAGYAAGEAILLVAVAAAWQARGRPRPPFPRVDLLAWRRHPVVAALAAVVAGAVAYQLFLVVATPPDNWDSMTYHLSRAAAWYQRHRVEYVPAHTDRQNAYQPNSELAILWTFVFLGRDTLAALPQWLAELATLTAVYGCARRLGFARPASLFASLLTATLTEIALQSVTTQNDLTSASLVLAAAYFALGRTRLDAALAGLAVALALGTKLTAVFALPLLAALGLARLGVRRLAEAAGFAVLAFAAVGFYGYGLNLVETGKPLGAASETTDYRPAITTGGTVSTVARLSWRLVDLSGWHPPASWARGVARGGKATFDALGIDPSPFESTGAVPFDFTPTVRPDEDLSTFGPLGVLLLVPLALGYAGALALRRTSAAYGLLALALPLTLVEVALAYRYNAWVGRFLVTPAALTMPLAAALYRSRAAAAAAALAGALSLGLTHSFNHAKPAGLDGTRAVWSLPRADAQTITRPELLQVVQGVEQHVPPRKTLGFILGPDDWDYPLYGPRLTRRLVPVPGVDTLAWAERNHVHWILLGTGAPDPPPRATWFRIRFHDSGWQLLLRPEELG